MNALRGPLRALLGVIFLCASAGTITLIPAGTVAAAPANDAFASPVAVSAPPYTTSQDTTGATLEAGEPQPSCAPSTRTVWYSFTPTAAGLYQVDTLGSGLDTVLAIYTGASLGSLNPVDCDDETASTHQSRIQLQATAGMTYRIQAGGYQDAAGTLTLNVFATPPAPTNNDFGAPAGVASLPFTDTRYNAQATRQSGERMPSCMDLDKTVWYAITPSVTANYTLDLVDSDFDTVLAVYTGSAVNSLTEVACNDDADTSTVGSRLSLQLTAGTTYRIQAGGVSFSGFGWNEKDYGKLVLKMTVAGSPDTDGDGCADVEELSSNPVFGGMRDPANRWDFYDVNGSKKVDSIDLSWVRSKFNPTGPTPPADLPYDRSGGAHPWAPGPPDNKINAVDIALVRAEFNHSCQAPP